MKSIRDDDRRLLGDLLVEAGVASRDGVTAGLDEQRLRGGRLGFNLMKLGEVTPVAFHFFLQDRFPILVPDLAEAMRYSPAIDLVPAGLAHHYSMVPVRAVDGVLDLAICGADTPLLLPALHELTGLRVEPVISPPSWVAEALTRFYPAEVAPGLIYRPSADNILVVSDPLRGIRPTDPEVLPEDAASIDWLRGIVAQGIERRALRIQVDPYPEALQIWFQGPHEADSGMSLPGGAFAGIASLIEGLSGIAAHPRSAPREGRVSLSIDRRRLAASILAVPGFDGHSYSLDLREERINSPARDTLERELPLLAAGVRRLAEERRGLIIIAGPGPAELETGRAAIETLLGEALPRRIAVDGPHGGNAESPIAGGSPPSALVERALAESPDLLIATEPGRRGDPLAALTLARDRVVLAPISAADAFDAAETIGRSGQAIGAEEAIIGILGVRLLEALCQSCGVPYDLLEVIPPGPRHRSIPSGQFAAGTGCAACRGSGSLELEPVFEFLPVAGEPIFRPGRRAAHLREEQQRSGQSTLLHATLEKASQGIIDVRESLRLLLHERL